MKNSEPHIFRKNNHRDSDKNKLRTFEPRGGENFRNVELQRKKSASYEKKCRATLITQVYAYWVSKYKVNDETNPSDASTVRTLTTR